MQLWCTLLFSNACCMTKLFSNINTVSQKIGHVCVLILRITSVGTLDGVKRRKTESLKTRFRLKPFHVPTSKPRNIGESIPNIFFIYTSFIKDNFRGPRFLGWFKDLEMKHHWTSTFRVKKCYSITKYNTYNSQHPKYISTSWTQD